MSDYSRYGYDSQGDGTNLESAENTINLKIKITATKVWRTRWRIIIEDETRF